MAQIPATKYSDGAGGVIDYTPTSDVTAGDVIVLTSLVAIALLDIAADELGSLTTEGVFMMPRVAETTTQGELLYWDPTGDPVGGTAGTGAVTDQAGALEVVGYAAAAAVAGDTEVPVLLARA